MQTISISDVPVQLFCEAELMADVRKVSLLERSKNGLGPDEPDVVSVSPTGEKERLTRKELKEEFVTLNGKKIKLLSMKYGARYTVMKVAARKGVYAFKVPMNSKYNILLSDGTKAKPGNYVVFEVNENGGIEYGSEKQVNGEHFTKIYRISKLPRMSVFAKRHMIKTSGIGGKTKNTDVSGRTVVNVGNDINVAEAEMLDSKAVDTAGNAGALGGIQSTGDVAVENDNRATAVGRLLRVSDGALVGFIIEFNGGHERVTKEQMMQMCHTKFIRNIKLTQREGKTFLSGIDMKIGDLPAEYV